MKALPIEMHGVNIIVVDHPPVGHTPPPILRLGTRFDFNRVIWFAAWLGLDQVVGSNPVTSFLDTFIVVGISFLAVVGFTAGVMEFVKDLRNFRRAKV